MAKKIKTSSYKIGHLIDQSGGMNNAVYPALLNDNEAKLLKNATLDEKGTVKTCKGIRERFAERFSTDPVNGITAFYPDTATSRLVIGSGTKLYKDTPHLVNVFDSQVDWERGEGSSLCEINDDLKIKEAEKHSAWEKFGSLGTTSSPATLEWGYAFDVAEPIRVASLKIYSRETDYYTITIWDDDTKNELVSKSVPAGDDSQWYKLDIDPITLTPGRYVISVLTEAGKSYYRDSNINSAEFNGITFVEGRRKGTAGHGFPSTTTGTIHCIAFDFETLPEKTIQEDWADGEGENIAIDEVEGLRFDGVDDYVNCGNPQAINDIGTGNFTITAMVKNEKTVFDHVNHAPIVVKSSVGTNHWGFDLKDGNTPRFYYGDNVLLNVANTSLVDKEWHHLARSKRWYKFLHVH